MKKLAAFILLILLFFPTYLFCKGQKEEQKAGEVTTIHFVGSAGGFGNAIAEGIGMFNDSYAGKYKVEGDFSSPNSKALLEKLTAEFIAKSDRYDVIAVSSPWVSAFGRYVRPLDELISEKGVDKSKFGTILNQAFYEKKVIGLPVRFGARVLFYRKDHYKQLGLSLPKTADEYLNNARKLTRDLDGDGKPDVYGSAIMTDPPLYTVASFVQFYFPFGGDFLTRDLQKASPFLLDPFTAKMLNVFKAQWDEGLIPDPFGMAFQDLVLAFQQGRVSMAQMYSARALLLEDPSVSKAAGNMAYAVLPNAPIGPNSPALYGGPWLLSINGRSEKTEASFEFINFLTSLEVQKHMALKSKNGPTLMDIYRDPEYQEANPAAGAIFEAISDIGFKEIFPVPKINELMVDTSRILQDFLLGKKDASETAKKIHDNVNEIMSQ